LPQVAPPIIESVRSLGIPLVDFAKKLRKRASLLWNYHEMNVIGHQAISEDAQLRFLELASGDLEVCVVVPVAKERPLPPDTALCHVVREPLDHEPPKSGHHRT
jgi:hypothetical protein